MCSTQDELLFLCNLYYKIAFSISGNSLLLNIGAQWGIYTANIVFYVDLHPADWHITDTATYHVEQSSL